MSKVKTIEIEDFRIYEGLSQFDFETELGIANLVVIYAPNGYGKTSFFDAVEWSFSNRIKRFEQEILKSEIDTKQFSSDHQILLTNRNSFKKGKAGRIKILTNDGGEIVRTVVPRKIQNQNFSFDYRPGTLGGTYSSEQIEKLPDSNILTQDQIDAFLRFKDPEEKFRDLKEFWPDGESAASFHKTITNYNRVIDKELVDTLDQIKSIEIELLQYLNSDENIQKTNIWIDRLKKELYLDFSVDLIQNDISEEVYHSLTNVNDSYIDRISRSLEDEEKNNAAATNLKVKFDNYSKLRAEVPSLSIKLNEIRQFENLLLEKEKLGKLIDEITNGITNTTLRLNDYQRFMILLPNRNKISQEIQSLELFISELYIENTNLLSRLNIYQQTNNNFLVILSKREKENIELKASYDEFDKNVADYNFWQSESANKRLSIFKIDTSLQKIKPELAGLILERNLLNDVLDLKNFDLLTDSFKNHLELDIKAYTSLNKTLNDISNEISNVQKDLQNSGNFEENLNRILNWGEEYVRELEESTCPLCKTQFDDVSSLITAIQRDKAEVLKISSLREKQISLQIRQLELGNEISILVKGIEDYLRLELNKLTSKISEVQIEIQNLESEKISLTNLLNNADLKLVPLNHFFDKFSVDILIDDDFKIEEFKLQMQATISENSVYIERLKKIIDRKTEMIRNNQNQHQVNRNEEVRSLNQIELLKTNLEYKEAESILLKYREPSHQSEIGQNEVESLISDLENMNIHRSTQNDILLEKDQKISQSNLHSQQEKLSELKRELEASIENSKKEVSFYENQFLQTIKASNFELAEIESFLEQKSLLIKKLENNINELKDFATHLVVIQNSVRKNKLEGDLNFLKRREPNLRRAQERLTKAKNDCIKYIDKGINAYFNKEVINEVYRRIEPHPDLTLVEFKPEVSDKGPRLTIRAKGENDEVNPVLYLSAGQVNVLSLSIFLAKAFESKVDTISTIFMDDPVQNLSDINVLSFIDLLRTIITTHDKQIVISTHDEKFFRLLQNKLPSNYFRTKYFEFESFGKLKPHQ